MKGIVYNSGMEIANLPPEDWVQEGGHTAVRPARASDTPTLQRLLQNEFYTHTHVDWYHPLDWVGEPSCVVYEEAGEITACLAITADPAPAAWVRLVALTYTGRPLPRLQAMMAGVLPALAEQGVTDVYWMSTKRWADRWLGELGFSSYEHLEAYEREGVTIPPGVQTTAVAGLQIRPVLPEDFGILAQLEARTYAPLWRHSARALHRGWLKAIGFDVARLHGRVVGFQHSVGGDYDSAHLARITIDPAVQGQGIGSALMAHAFQNYAQRGIQRVTLNTQEGNDLSHHLYRKFGFLSSHYRLPIWRRSI
jgi:ribosomal protein S18 acetylase RimI-like enzyme